MNLLRFCLAAACLGWMGLPLGKVQAGEPATPLQFLSYDLLTGRPQYNRQSQRGVPLSSELDVPPGSDGRAPVGVVGTSGQFQSLFSVGGTARPTSEWGTKTGTLAENAKSLGLPYVSKTKGKVASYWALVFAQVGGAYFSPQGSYSLGSEIPPPATDEYGKPLAQGIRPEDYWRPEPFWDSAAKDSDGYHVGASYHWSPNAGRVFATEAGLATLVWLKAEALTDIGTSDPALFVEDSGNYYRRYTQRVLVAASPVKPPKQMFWTQGDYVTTGTPVSLSGGLVAAVKFAYNAGFPETVDATQALSVNGTPFTSTIYYDSQNRAIFAANVEGRIFVELLGDLQGNRRKHLGFEIVSVSQAPTPVDVAVELGERLTVPGSEPGIPGEDEFYPTTPTSVSSTTYYVRQSVPGSDRVRLFATREAGSADGPLVQWLEVGEGGLRWPRTLVRYTQFWPTDPAKYSHYLRPPAASPEEALQTAIQLPTENVPVILYQDDEANGRAKITGAFKFYSFVEESYPLHRTLIQYSSGQNLRFERVFSWLAGALAFEGTAPGWVENAGAQDWLSGWNAGTHAFDFPDSLRAPRVHRGTVEVGQRLAAPVDEVGSAPGAPYVAGHLRKDQGHSYDVQAYRDPLEVGFEEAARGAIIPVNSIPGSNTLEVWWFRPSAPDLALGFRPVLWPSILGRYTVEWPAVSRQIVLASNQGSGALGSLEAKGRIYYENDRAKDGFNPNEEHALMSGGQAFALRDDLNVVAPDAALGETYSSEPFVLLEYVEADGRPAMVPFQVVREVPGISFAYEKEAGAILQPPMPLPLLDVPLSVPRAGGADPISFNTELAGFWSVAASTAEPGGGTILTTTSRSPLKPYSLLSLQKDAGGRITSLWFYPTNVAYAALELHGYVLPERPRPATVLGVLQDPIPSPILRLHTTDTAASNWAPDSLILVVASGSQATWTGRLGLNQGGELWLEFPDAATAREVLALEQNPELALISPDTTNYRDWRIANEPLPEAVGDPGVQAFYSSFTLKDRKGNLWIYRGPHVPGDLATMQMQFYYKTLPSFFFPSKSLDQQPPAGTLTPYLRERDADGAYVGDAVFADADGDGLPDGNSLAVTYHPVWPANTPVLQMAETLTLPKRGLPAVRGQTSLQVVYQQSLVDGLDRRSVVLHDPTREKVFELGPKDGTSRLGAIPDSVKTETSRGKTYFPSLPPHLAQRFFLDPDRGPSGALVFRGEFVDEPVGEKYLLLNVVGQADAVALKALCSQDDPRKALWDRVVDRDLKTRLERFVGNPARPGTFLASSPEDKGPGELSEVTDADIAVDSYALTATGPGVGYVTLLAGNGRAFTPVGEPTSMQIIRVENTLHPGEMKIILPQNPLSEQVTLQQTVDLAGRAEDYRFEWKIASPVDGLPPLVYRNVRRLLLDSSTWQHLAFPLPTDTPTGLPQTEENRLASDADGYLAALDTIPFDTAAVAVTAAQGDSLGRIRFHLPQGTAQNLVAGNQVVLRDTGGYEAVAVVASDTSDETVLDPGGVSVELDELPAQDGFDAARLAQIYERAVPGQPQSVVFQSFEVSTTNQYTAVYLSLDLDPALGVEVFLDGVRVATVQRGEGDTPAVSPPETLSPLGRVYRLGAELLVGGTATDHYSRTHTVVVQLFSAAPPDVEQLLRLRIEAFESTDETSVGWLPLSAEKFIDGVRAVLGGTADVRSLADNYVIMRYQAVQAGHASFQDLDGDGVNDAWSTWTTPQLAEGWIKRVLAGINPFNQRVSDLFNNRVNTDVSLLTQAGPRWEGDVALNLETINASGLIEIYETILRRGKLLSIGGGINYGPANDALLLVVGYLNDLYSMLGNEAWADAANPTIGIGTKDQTYGEVATALFAFKGQMPSLLEEELALLRGRDDFLQPGVETPPVYNRLFWNYTRGIDSGEAIYALNYNIQENPSHDPDGVVNADDARRMYPQGHGDAYGHYLTALKGYYGLLLDTDFDWVPRTEAVTILGKPVQVDYFDERKFAATAAALARTGKQIFDLTWRRDYQPGADAGWESFGQTRVNTRRTQVSTRFWGLDHWATRTGGGAYLNWVVGNALLPETDTDPEHEGIQKIDRTTVPELVELPAIMEDLQTSLENDEAHLTPLGLPAGGVAFDIDPNQVVGGANSTHFEQIYARARTALNNALAAFDDAKDVTRLMRSEEDSLADFRAQVEQQELAYAHSLIEIYGTPYTDDIGPGRTYPTGFTGPDLIHYPYVDVAELNTPLFVTDQPTEVRIDVQAFPDDYLARLFASPSWIVPSDAAGGGSSVDFPFLNLRAYREGEHYLTYTLDSHGFNGKPREWTGRRASPGQIQQAISGIIRAQNWAGSAFADMDWAKWDLDKSIQLFYAGQALYNRERAHLKDTLDEQAGLSAAVFASDLITSVLGQAKQDALDAADLAAALIPSTTILGTAVGGDLGWPGRFSIKVTSNGVATAIDAVIHATDIATRSLQQAQEQVAIYDDYNHNQPWENEYANQQAVVDIGAKLSTLQGLIFPINSRLQELDDARRNYQGLVAKGNRLQEEREVYRKRAAAVVQGFRTRDAAFRVFRSEKLERYKTLFDLAARYAFLAAQAYDYETGLLDTDRGRQFLQRIVGARALGVVRGGEPQYAGSNTGDPGLSSALAEMKADWEVLKGRLGFNNPDAYGTTASLRSENYRILPGADGESRWRDVLQQGRMEDLRADPDVKRYCLQIGSSGDLPVPGIVLSFSTSIADGLNFFGKPLAPGDHALGTSSFATKIFSVGVAFEGYQGMDDPVANTAAIVAGGGTPVQDPSAVWLNPTALAANPYVYLIPVGVDSLRTPPLGEGSAVRTWNVNDVTVPLPFNLGGSDFSTKQLFQSGDSLTEELFSTRKHQSFRPVSSVAAFYGDLYGSNGQLRPSPYTNRRLIGRSAWNSKWKLVIPGRTLLQNSNEGLDRFTATVCDVKLHFVTYSYSGN